MQLYLDDRIVETADADTLDQAIDIAARAAERAGRLIVEVHVDGRSLDEDELEFERTKKTQPDEVRLTSADPHETLRQTFAEAADALAHADALQRDAAGLIEQDDQQQAMERLGSALEIWANVHRAVLIGIEIGGFDLAEEASEDEAAPVQTISELESHLRALRDAMQRRDTVGLSDALQYDLPDVVAEWREMLTHLQQQLERHLDGGEGSRS